MQSGPKSKVPSTVDGSSLTVSTPSCPYGVRHRDPLHAKYAQAVGCCRSLGLIVPGASAAIGPRRTLLWSALVVSYRRLGPLRPEAISEVILPRRFWSSVTSDLAMPIAESDRASCCPAGSRGACCDKSGLCQRGSKAEAMVLPPNSL